MKEKTGALCMVDRGNSNYDHEILLAQIQSFQLQVPEIQAFLLLS